MPQNKNASIRYQIIDKCLTSKQRKFPSLSYLAEKCSEVLGVEVEESTIEKDIADMRHSAALGFDAPIAYNRQNKGYHYTEQGFSIRELFLSDEQWEALRYAASQLYQYKDIPVFENFKTAIERINSRFDISLELNDPFLIEFVQYEKRVSNNGYEWLADIFTAIRNCYKLQFDYENIYKKEVKSYDIVPYLLKEIRNRWYLVGWSDSKSHYVTFSLDRIKALRVESSKQKKRSDFNAEQFFRNSIGIMESGDKPEIVKMTIKAPYNRLVQLEPLHHSQRIIKETATAVQIEILVDINQELCFKALSFGPYCTIQKPKALVDEIKRLIAETSKNYR